MLLYLLYLAVPRNESLSNSFICFANIRIHYLKSDFCNTQRERERERESEKEKERERESKKHSPLIILRPVASVSYKYLVI